jgi:8-oxo-dGTP diphosphatase
MSIDRDRFPRLASTQYATWANTRMRLLFEPLPPDENLIGNVRFAGFSGDQILLIDTEDFGPSTFPGGVLEPEESWMEALERELLEEAGGRASSIHVVGRIRVWSGADGPYRPHLPFPELHQVVTHGDVDLVGTPTNPPGGEHVLWAGFVPLDVACERLLAGGNEFEADMLRYVVEVRDQRVDGGEA